jgi:hypothetical protein
VAAPGETDPGDRRAGAGAITVTSPRPGRRVPRRVPPILGGAPTELPAPPPRPALVEVEVLAPVLLASGLALAREGSPLDLVGVGRAVHRDDVDRYPLSMREEHRRLWELFHRLHGRYAGVVVVRILAPSSLRWYVASLRHRVWRYPAFIVADRVRITGLDEQALVELIDQRLREVDNA